MYIYMEEISSQHVRGGGHKKSDWAKLYKQSNILRT